MIFDQEIIIDIHQRMIERTGGSKGIRDLGMLNSVVNSIYQTFDGKDLYPSII